MIRFTGANVKFSYECYDFSGGSSCDDDDFVTCLTAASMIIKPNSWKLRGQLDDIINTGNLEPTRI